MKTQIEKYRKEIAAGVKALRQKRGWTQKELAELLGLSQNWLSELENGKGSFSAEQIFHY